MFYVLLQFGLPLIDIILDIKGIFDYDCLNFLFFLLCCSVVSVVIASLTQYTTGVKENCGVVQYYVLSQLYFVGLNGFSRTWNDNETLESSNTSPIKLDSFS